MLNILTDLPVKLSVLFFKQMVKTNVFRRDKTSELMDRFQQI